jgi:hypothetical protein
MHKTSSDNSPSVTRAGGQEDSSPGKVKTPKRDRLNQSPQGQFASLMATDLPINGSHYRATDVDDARLLLDIVGIEVGDFDRTAAKRW